MNVYEIITNRIISALDSGVVPWRQSWTTSTPKNAISRKPYRGVNVFLLNAGRFTSSYFLTYKQAQAKGGNIRKGEKSTPVIFWRTYPSDQVNGDGTPKRAFVLRYYSLFNLTQTEGIEIPVEEGRLPTFEPIEACQRIVDGYAPAPTIVHGGNQACYSPSRDEVSMPSREAFETEEAYYACLYHELSHSTGHKDRLNRDGIAKVDHFGSHQYSFEELVAEMGSSFLCGEAGIIDQTVEMSTAYISGWVSKLQSNPKWVVQAGAQAAKAADLILNRKAEKETSEED